MYPRNTWYVAGWSKDFDRSLKPETFLDKNIAIYREEDGSPAALEDACPHRKLPLPGDAVECGNHGPTCDRKPEKAFEGRELATVRHAEKLTVAVGDMEEADVIALPRHGLDDGQILEINQIVGNFNSVNRLPNGLSVSTTGDVVGYYSGSTVS